MRSSRLQRRLVALAWLTTAITAALLVAAALAAPSVAGLVAAAAAIAAMTAAGAAARGSPQAPLELMIDARGAIAVRRGEETAPAEAVFVAAWLICLRTGPRSVMTVWRDALEGDGFRRLAAAGRWRLRRTPEQGGMSDPIA